MHDIKDMRANPQTYVDGLIRRGVSDAEDQVKRLIVLDKALRDNETEKQKRLAERNTKSRQIGEAMKAGNTQEAEHLKGEVAAAKDWIAAYDLKQDDIPAQQRERLLNLPNIPAEDVPDGVDESDNVEIARRGGQGEAGRHHADFGPDLGMDFEAGTLLAGTRNTVLRGQMARLQRALGQFMIDIQTDEAGYQETAIPLLVKREVLEGTGQLPKFEEDLFVTTDDRWLIPTAEVGLTNLVREQIVDLDKPMRLTALTQCFRAEAGAAGRDTRGYIRQHREGRAGDDLPPGGCPGRTRSYAGRRLPDPRQARTAVSRRPAVRRRHGFCRAPDLRHRSLDARPKSLPRNRQHQLVR